MRRKDEKSVDCKFEMNNPSMKFIHLFKEKETYQKNQD